ncbi:MAG TPA: oligosaccharide flippase family protein [Patescibacteria group bacterium]|nr:oligosaccharide flippase family protein [Patescibacteria group bacterium]
MKRHLDRVISLAKSGTAKDTYVLFGGNLFSAFLGFLFTVVIARGLSLSDFGIFSAASNLIGILLSVTDLGLSNGVINFVSTHLSKAEGGKADQYAKAALIVKVVISTVVSLGLIVFAGFISRNWLATTDKTVAYLVSVVSFSSLAWHFLPNILQARKMFFKSVLIDIFQGMPKVIIPLAFLLLHVLTVKSTLFAFALSCLIAAVPGFIFTGSGFLKVKIEKGVYPGLLKYSSWLGVNKVASSVANGLDIQMLAGISGATITGLYSIPARLTSFLNVLSGSFSAVLAPRLAGFGSKEAERTYLVKSSLVTGAVILFAVSWIIFAKPIILILFGTKYLLSVPYFKALILSMLPSIATIPSVSAINYSIRKTAYIGAFSIFRLPTTFLLNLFFIPKYGGFGPALTFSIINTIFAVYTWLIVIKHYWFSKS